MRWWLVVVGLGLCSVQAVAAGPVGHALRMSAEQPRATRSFDIHLVQQSPFDPAPIHQSGMIAQTGVAPNMELGVGLFSARRNRLNSFEPKSDSRPKVSRKLGLSFNWRF
jgi:hypothetical protein